MARRLSAKRIAEIRAARLDSVAGLQVLRAAGRDREIWYSYVDSAVRDALFPIFAQASVIGMSEDDLLAEIEDYLFHAAKMRTSVMPVLEFIELQLDLAIEQHRDARITERAVVEAEPKIAARAHAAAKSAATKPARDAAIASSDREVEAWLTQIATRPKGQLKKVAEWDIASREGITVGAVQRRIARYRRRQKSL